MAQSDRQAIRRGVYECIVNVLDLETTETFGDDARLIDDLGADSLDLLDLIFHLEQHFNVKLSVRDLEKRTQALLGGAAVEIDGIYTPEALDHLRRALPEVPPEELAQGLSVQTLPRSFRVATMINLVAKAMEAQNE